MKKGTSTPAWITVKIWLAMVMVPVRESELGLAETENVTTPLPLPRLPEVIEIHESLLMAVPGAITGCRHVHLSAGDAAVR
jgi:hypothetical protein